MANNLLSVIVPIYNVEKYLPRCLESIINQTYKNLEIILVDDGSPDNCPQICDEYAKKDNRIKVIHKVNGGVSSARNVGIENSSGKYITFVDSDDYLEKTMLQKLHFEIQNEVDIVMCGFRYITIEGIVLSIKNYDNFTLEISPFTNLFFEKGFTSSYLCSAYAKLYKNSIINENDLRFNEDFSICEDGIFVVQYLKKCKRLTNIDECLCDYLQTSDVSLMKKFNRNGFVATEFYYNEIISFLNNFIFDDGSLERINMNFLGRFLDFSIQIYSRNKKLNKLKILKEFLSNKILKHLLKVLKPRTINIKFKLQIFLMKNPFLFHIVYSIRSLFYSN